mgnify:CR=1 FL=1
MHTAWQNLIEDTLGKITQLLPLSGGDTSRIYQLEVANTMLVAKTNTATSTPDLLKVEQLGLTALANYDALAVPSILLYESREQGELLVIQHIPTGNKSAAALRQFGQQLAQLHQNSTTHAGWDYDNYIGKLYQSNQQHAAWYKFYAQERLLPQIQLAIEAGLLNGKEVPTSGRLEQVCFDLLGTPTISPLHGDLWSGNYIIDKTGQAYLIDPSFHYGHSEVDLAMSKLFGGFGPNFYEAYHEVLPLEAGAEARQDLYQLYYLLVHLNMFGRSYLGSVRQILNRYF